MKALYLLFFLLFSFTGAHAQSGKVPEPAESPAKMNVVQTFPESNQKEEDKQAAEGRAQRQPLPIKQRVAARETAKRKAAGKGYLYFNDFTGEMPGTMPSRWFASEGGQLRRLSGRQGLWLSLAKKASYAPAPKFPLPDAFTLEFDLLLFSPPEKGLGTFSLSLAAIEEQNPTEAWRFRHTTAHLYVGWNYSTFTVQQAGREEKHHRKHNILRQGVGQPLRITIAVNGSRYTLWVNDEKIMDIAGLIEEDHAYNSLLLKSRLSDVDEMHQVLISNIKLSTGQVRQGRAKKNEE